MFSKQIGSSAFFWLLLFLLSGDRLAAARFAPDFHWAKTGFPKNGLSDIAVDRSGQVYALFNLLPRTELYGEVFDIGDGRTATVIAKLSATGEFLEFIDVGFVGLGQALAVDDEGSILVGGIIGLRETTFDVWGRSYEVNGASYLETPGPDAFVLKLDSSGGFEWFRHFGGVTRIGTGEEVRDLAVDSDGNVAVVGSWRGAGRFGTGVASAGGESDGFVALLSKDGAHRWIHMIGTPNDGGDQHTTGRGDISQTVAMDSDGSVIVGGRFKGVVPVGHHTVTSRVVPKSVPPRYSQDGFVVKIARSGRVMWADAIGGDSTDTVLDVTVGPNQDIVATGVFRETLSPDHGGFEAHPNGGTDIFLVKYDRDGGPTLSLKLGADKDDVPNSVHVDAQGRIFLFATTGYLEFDDIFVLPTGTRGGSMFCFDELGNGIWGMGGFFWFSQAVPLPGSSGSQFLVHGSVQTGQSFFEGYSSDFTIQQDGPGIHVLLSVDGAPWPDDESSEARFHPADLNKDWRLEINEVTGYGRAWKTGALWVNEPNPVPINYLTRAGAIWKNGERYTWNADIGEMPQGWVNQPE